MRGVILAAGRGSRLGALTQHRPKCLTRVFGRPILEIQIEALTAAGVDEISLVTGYRAGELDPYPQVKFHNPHWESTQMVQSLSAASDWLLSDRCIVSYSDIFYEPSAVQSLIQSSQILSFTYDPNWLPLWTRRFDDPLEDAESFSLDDLGNLVEIGAPAKDAQSVQGQFMGLMSLTPESWGALWETHQNYFGVTQRPLQLTQCLNQMVAYGHRAPRAIPYHGLWGEIDRPHDIIIYQEDAAMVSRFGEKA